MICNSTLNYNDYSELVTMGNEFERIIPFGWSIFGFISRSLIRPLFNFFAMFISNYGIIILLLTFLIRLALFPLQYKMILNGVKMSVMKPEMEAMRAKHKDDPAGMQAAQMKMYQDYGLNPLGLFAHVNDHAHLDCTLSFLPFFDCFPTKRIFMGR